MAALPIPPHPPLLPPADNRVSLYAGDLHPDVTEYDLFVLFSTIGPLSSFRLCRDRISRKSLCYAYINYHLHSHAAEALSRLNHTELLGKPVRIMWSQRDPIVRRTGMANLFVKNLDSSVTEVQIEKVFGKFGTIISCKVAKDFHGKSKGFGFVQFDSEESAKDALDALDNTTLGGKTIIVSKFLKKSERKEPEFTNVYVKNLDKDLTEILFRDKFSEYGNVTSAVIMKDPEGKSRGFGFVNFESHDDAKKAIQALNGATIGSKKWFVGKAMNKAEREGFLRQGLKPNISNLFVRNLSTSVDEKILENVFGAFGRVISTSVIRGENGISRGFGYICFSNPCQAMKARDSLNGTFLHGKYMIVTVARSKEECSRNSQTRFGPNYLPNLNISSIFLSPPWVPIYGPEESSKEGKVKDQKSCLKPDSFDAAARDYYQTRGGLLWEMRKSELRKVLSSEKTLKMQVEKAIRANEVTPLSKCC